MIYFQCDYAEGAHPRIIEAITRTNMHQTVGYGKDEYCASAKEKIKKACNTDGDVHFLVGGTQANTVVISSILRAHEGVVSADTGHIATHETGAIEATGHAVIRLSSEDGKITADAVRSLCQAHFESETAEHTVKPGMVYISHPTESGTLYSKAELDALSYVCREFSIPLYLDGARLGYGLTSPYSDLTLEDVARLTDVFYIGGTKCGALFGEAVVITNDSLKADFRYHIKQHGGMLAKGRLLGIQFDVLFEDGLYFDICRHANELAFRIRDAIVKKGLRLYGKSQTNQQFLLLTDDQLARVRERFACDVWERYDESYCIVRFCTSWATQDDAVDALLAFIENSL